MKKLLLATATCLALANVAQAGDRIPAKFVGDWCEIVNEGPLQKEDYQEYRRGHCPDGPDCSQSVPKSDPATQMMRGIDAAWDKMAEQWPAEQSAEARKAAYEADEEA